MENESPAAPAPTETRAPGQAVSISDIGQDGADHIFKTEQPGAPEKPSELYREIRGRDPMTNAEFVRGKKADTKAAESRHALVTETVVQPRLNELLADPYLRAAVADEHGVDEPTDAQMLKAARERIMGDTETLEEMSLEYGGKLAKITPKAPSRAAVEDVKRRQRVAPALAAVLNAFGIGAEEAGSIRGADSIARAAIDLHGDDRAGARAALQLAYASDPQAFAERTAHLGTEESRFVWDAVENFPAGVFEENDGEAKPREDDRTRLTDGEYSVAVSGMSQDAISKQLERIFGKPRFFWESESED